MTGRESEKGGRWVAPHRGGALPAFEGIDGEMIAGLISEYGPDGSRHTGTKMEGAGGTDENFRDQFAVPDPFIPPPSRDRRKKWKAWTGPSRPRPGTGGRATPLSLPSSTVFLGWFRMCARSPLRRRAGASALRSGYGLATCWRTVRTGAEFCKPRLRDLQNMAAGQAARPGCPAARGSHVPHSARRVIQPPAKGLPGVGNLGN